MMTELAGFFLSMVEIPSMSHGKSQAMKTLINEEAKLLGKYLRNDRKIWIPRIACMEGLKHS